MHGRPLSAWWDRYPGKGVQATQLLTDFRPAIEREIVRCECLYPGSDIDWPFTIWDSAYRAAWRCDGPFWGLLKQAMRWTVAKQLTNRKKRNARLKRVRFNWDEDERFYYTDIYEE